ncbi:DUF3871 family protein [Emticicia sp. CRIBPO]|uniref:DUF3871 family protein n=1 Tax=Emticicia sp. CRIBPO TaxID=2683258 RepID=UPI001412E19F|nr:DUF3871 family protein [Emticicia sp. CRIBPO]NBA84767.1 DUF3871 family protein [Emticicia sp. CRIBPO]
MNSILINSSRVNTEMKDSNGLSFIQANTIPMSYRELRENHLIPVFVKDNEPVISHIDFINSTMDMVQQCYHGEVILNPSIRVSHPIKGRIPEAKDKPANELLDFEKTIYYERMAFMIEIPSIKETIDGNNVSLTVGGVKSYASDNLHNRKGVDEHFKIFIGFQNKVCCNLCIWSDGYVEDLRVKNLAQLMNGVYTMIVSFSIDNQINSLNKLKSYYLTDNQFASLMGRTRLYHYLSSGQKNKIPELRFGDTQLGMIARDYYHDQSFCRESDGSINLWKVYNLFTGANKQSYIDTFLSRGVNAFEFVDKLAYSLESNESNWFLS